MRFVSIEVSLKAFNFIEISDKFPSIFISFLNEGIGILSGSKPFSVSSKRILFWSFLSLKDKGMGEPL